MKTAEECWEMIKDPQSPMDLVIQEIQLDAYKAGMTKAAELVALQPFHSDFPLEGPESIQMSAKICAARDNTTNL